jgi:hypothetical protein
MKRPRQHVMEDASGRLFQSLLPEEWIVRPIAKDYGVDFEVELVDQKIVSGDRAIARWPVADRFPGLSSARCAADTKAACCKYFLSSRQDQAVMRSQLPVCDRRA